MTRPYGHKNTMRADSRIWDAPMQPADSSSIHTNMQAAAAFNTGLPNGTIMSCNVRCQSLLSRLWSNIEDFDKTIRRASGKALPVIVHLKIMLDARKHKILR